MQFTKYCTQREWKISLVILLDFKIVLAKFLTGMYNVSHSRNTLVSHVSCWEYFQLMSHYTSQFFKQQEENVDTAILEGLKTKHTSSVIHAKFFCAWFSAIDLESILQISILKTNISFVVTPLYQVYILH